MGRDSTLPDPVVLAQWLARLLEEDYDLCFCGISLWNPERQLFIEHVFIPGDAEPVHLRLEDLDDYGFGASVQTGQPRIVYNLENEAMRRGEWEAHKRYGTASYITLPLTIAGNVIGAFGLGSHKSGHFILEDIYRLRPLMRLLELSIKPSRFRNQAPAIHRGTTKLRSLRIVAANSTLREHVAGLLPLGIEAEFHQALEDALPSRTYAPLYILVLDTLSFRKAAAIAAALRQHPVRLLVLCIKSRPGPVHRLTAAARDHGLLGIRDLSDLNDVRARIVQSYFAGLISFDWNDFGISEAVRQRSNLLDQAVLVLEAEPFYDWRVEELAKELGVSRWTLNRAVHDATGSSAKHFLLLHRYRVLDFLRTHARLSGARVAELLAFPSNKAMYEWARKREMEMEE